MQKLDILQDLLVWLFACDRPYSRPDTLMLYSTSTILYYCFYIYTIFFFFLEYDCSVLVSTKKKSFPVSCSAVFFSFLSSFTASSPRVSLNFPSFFKHMKYLKKPCKFYLWITKQNEGNPKKHTALSCSLPVFNSLRSATAN